MSSQYKGNLLTGVIATHFAGMMILLNKSADYRLTSRYYGMDSTTLYLMFFIFDIPVFFFLWSIVYKPLFEAGARTVGLFWTLQANIVLLPTGDIGGGFLFVSILEIILLVWPKRYLPLSEIDLENSDEETTRITCRHCGATYAYSSTAILNKETTCQNCGKLLET